MVINWLVTDFRAFNTAELSHSQCTFNLKGQIIQAKLNFHSEGVFEITFTMYDGFWHAQRIQSVFRLITDILDHNLH